MASRRTATRREILPTPIHIVTKTEFGGLELFGGRIRCSRDWECLWAIARRGRRWCALGCHQAVVHVNKTCQLMAPKLIPRHSNALLHIAEQWRAQEGTRRPLNGFASIGTFDPSTREHEALAEGYEDVLARMVCGDKIPLDEGISLAVSLDPGPAKPYEPPPYGDHHGVSHPRR